MSDDLVDKKISNTQTVIIKQLGIETTVKDLIKDWNICENEFNEEVIKSSYYTDELISVEKDKDGNFHVTIDTRSDWGEIMEIINKVYDEKYLFIVKDEWYGKVPLLFSQEKMYYTSFVIEKSGSGKIFGEINFKNNSGTLIPLNEVEQKEFKTLKENETINYMDLIDQQEIFFIKEKLFNNDNWLFFIKEWGYTVDQNIDKNQFVQTLPVDEDIHIDKNTIMVQIGSELLEYIGIITHYKGKPFTGVCYYKHENGNFQQKCEMVNGLKHGKHILYTWKGLVEEVFEIKNGIDQTYRCYYENGQLQEEGNYKKGKKNGIWREYCENGQLKFDRIYQEGDFISQKDENGNIIRTKDKNNTVKVYHTNGQLRRETVNVDKNIKRITTYSDSGSVLSKQIKIIELDGKERLYLKSFYQNGQVKLENLQVRPSKPNHRGFRVSKYHGIWKEYYENGQLKIETNLDMGEVISEKCWDEHGNEI